MRVILLIMIGLSLLQADFSKTGDIVKDSVSGLEFQDDAVGSRMKWEAAISHCEALTLGGYSDWRLPNVNELKSIADRSKVNPAIVDAFTNTNSYYYWSSSTFEGSKGYAWFVYFGGGGFVGYGSKDSNYDVMCVRDVQ